MNRHLTACAAWFTVLGAVLAAPKDNAAWLVRIPLTGNPADLPIPVLAHLQQADGGEYVLAKASPEALQQMGRPYQVLDRETAGGLYWLAEHPLRTAGRLRPEGRFELLLDDGLRWLVKADDPDAVQGLADAGFELAELGDRPLVFGTPTLRSLPVRTTALLEADPLVQELLGTVTTGRLARAMDELTGPVPTVADGAYAAIATRHTAAGRPVQRATSWMHARFQALGLDPSYQAWTRSGYANSNVVGVLPGTTAPSEIVVLCAHLDSMPTGALAPGADDNASGSLAVLAAAEAFRRYRFERTVRFVLFTGEEQGLYGSRAYADAAGAAGDHIVAVVNLDMIAWDGNGDGLVQLHTRVSSNPGYAADLAIAEVFTNVVATYALAPLAPSIRASGIPYSDHYRFWAVGYPGVLAIEDYGGDFHPYYHTVNDVAAHINWPYYAACVQAALGTAAHLAGPVGRTPFDAVRVASGPFVADSPVGHGTFVARHSEGAEEGDDPGDVAHTEAATGPFAERLELFTQPGADALWMDTRPAASETVFQAHLRAVCPDASWRIWPQRLHFEFAGPPEADAVYLARVTVAGTYRSDGVDYACVTNLREVVAAGGFLELPATLRVTNGTLYGTCEIRRLGLSREPRLAWERATGDVPRLRVEGPPGVQVVDTLEWSGTLTNWTVWAVSTNRVAVDDAGFDDGEHPLLPETPPPPADGVPRFYRLGRQWLSP